MHGFLKKLSVWFNPSFFVMCDHYDKDWDDCLNYIMDKKIPIKNYDGYVLKAKDVPIWVSNYPFAYGTPWGLRHESRKKRASRYTIYRFKKYVDQQLKEPREETYSKLYNLMKEQ